MLPLLSLRAPERSLAADHSRDRPDTACGAKGNTWLLCPTPTQIHKGAPESIRDLRRKAKLQTKVLSALRSVLGRRIPESTTLPPSPNAPAQTPAPFVRLSANDRARL